jgi:uncharacterized membrane protein
LYRFIPGEVMVNPAMGSSFSSRVASPLQNGVPCLFALILFAFASMVVPAETLAGKPGGKGPSSGAQSLPIRLGIPSGCGDSEGYGMNSGSFPGSLVVAGMANCRGQGTTAYTWRDGSWQAVSASSGGIATDVSNFSTHSAEPTVVGFFDGDAGGGFVQSPVAALKILPLLAGMDYFYYSARISDRGGHIVGGNSPRSFTGTAATAAVRWTLSGSSWVPETLGPGAATAVSDDGSVVTGFGPEGAWVWLAKQSGGGTRSTLSSASLPHDMASSATATIIVGYREQPCPDPCGSYPVPVYWTEKAGQWKRTDLAALDDVDSEAMGVAEVNGRFVIVGYGYTKKDGIQRAVAWKQAANGSFGSPLRLAAIDGRSRAWARAVDVNGNGLVLGNSSGGGLSSEAVLWTLPQ